MTDSSGWLDQRLRGAPADLRQRMQTAVADTSQTFPLHERLARAAAALLARAIRGSSRESAFDLLAADALMTHACEAAALDGTETLAAFAAAWSPERFAQLQSTQS